jgi:predicted transport protein
MHIFQLKNSTLSPVSEKKIDLEKDVQKLTEANLQTVFGLQFVSTEFALHNFRIDTLAFDSENNSFVIIEYKRDRSFSVIDQGYSYLSLMLNNKADFILEYTEKTKQSLKREDVDWSQTKVMFIANSFTTYQQNAINFKDLPIELWEVKIFDNDTVGYNQLLSPESTESIKTVTKNKTIAKVSTEVKVYTVDDHINGVNDKIQSLFSQLREKILALDSGIEERAKKMYISYRLKNAFAYVHLQQGQIKIHLIVNKKDLDDPLDFSRDVTQVGHYGGGITEVNLTTPDDLGYVMGLIEQSHKAAK